MDEITTNEILFSIQHTKGSVCNKLMLLELDSKAYENIKKGAMMVHQKILAMDESKTSKDKLDQLTELDLLMRIENVILDFVNWKPKDIKPVTIIKYKDLRTVFTNHIDF